MNISKFKKILYERREFYVLGYVFGYIFSIIYMGIPNLLYLIPIKLSCVIFAVVLGNAFYYGSKKMRGFEATFRNLKSCIFIGGLIIVITVLQYLLYKVGIDITTFIGL